MDPIRRATLSLAVIALSVLAIAVASRLRPPPPPPPGELVERVFSFPGSEVTQLAIRSWQGALAAVKENGAWRVQSVQLADAHPAGGAGGPAATPSPEFVNQTIADLVESIVKLPQIDRFARAGQPLPSFGLEKPQATIDMHLADGGEAGLVVGELTLTNAALYARVLPQDDIVQIGNPIFNDIGAALFRLSELATTPSDPGPK